MSGRRIPSTCMDCLRGCRNCASLGRCPSLMQVAITSLSLEAQQANSQSRCEPGLRAGTPLLPRAWFNKRRTRYCRATAALTPQCRARRSCFLRRRRGRMRKSPRSSAFGRLHRIHSAEMPAKIAPHLDKLVSADACGQEKTSKELFLQCRLAAIGLRNFFAPQDLLAVKWKRAR